MLFRSGRGDCEDYALAKRARLLAAGVAIGHCTEQQLSAMREEMLAIMKESYIKGSNDHYEATLGKVRK